VCISRSPFAKLFCATARGKKKKKKKKKKKNTRTENERSKRTGTNERRAQHVFRVNDDQDSCQDSCFVADCSEAEDVEEYMDEDLVHEELEVPRMPVVEGHCNHTVEALAAEHHIRILGLAEDKVVEHILLEGPGVDNLLEVLVGHILLEEDLGVGNLLEVLVGHILLEEDLGFGNRLEEDLVVELVELVGLVELVALVELAELAELVELVALVQLVQLAWQAQQGQQAQLELLLWHLEPTCHTSYRYRLYHGSGYRLLDRLHEQSQRHAYAVEEWTFYLLPFQPIL
jgi:hypothetical protein